jgi:uncharacterized protein (TIGR00369 family)
MLATALNQIPAPPSSKLLGWHLLDARPEDGWIRIGFDGKREFCNPAGFVQGGILSAMLDDTMGPAVFVMTEGRLCTATITMTVNFLAPARPGPITGEATVTQLGKTVAFVEGRLFAGGRHRACDRDDECATGRSCEGDKDGWKLKGRHCEERSDEGIHSFLAAYGLLRFARNDVSSSSRAARPEAARSAVLR